MKAFKVSFSLADSEYMTALRLVVGAVCSSAGLDIDASEDFKVCVTESCLVLKGCGFEEAEVSLMPQKGVCAYVKGSGGCPQAGDNEFSLALISALVSDCKIEKQGEAISSLTLTI